MKRRFTILTAALALIVSLAIPMGVWGQTRETTTGTLTMSSSQTSPVTVNGVTFTWTSANIVTGGGNSSGFKANSNMTVTIPSGAILTKIEKTNGNNWGSGATISVYAGSDATGTEIASIVTGTHVYNISSNNTGTTYYFANSTAKNAWIKSLSITYEASSGASTTVSIDATGITNTDVYTSTEAGLLSATVTSGDSPVSGATVTWSGDNDNVATIASDGTVTLVGAGTVNFTASYAGVSGQYQPSSVTYEMTVTSSAPYVQPTTIEANLNDNFFGTNYGGSAAGITDDNPVSGTLDNVTITYAGSGNHYINATQIRFYPNNKLQFDAPSGYEITQIVFTSAGTWAATINANNGTYTSDTKTWTGSEASVLFTGSGSSRCDMSKATITLAPIGSAVATTTTINAPSDFNNDIYHGTNAGILTATVTPEGGSALDNPAITWSSSNTGVATIDANGAVTLVAVGTTTITASYAGVTDQYKPSSATYSLEVTDSTPVLEATFIFNTDEGLADLDITKPNAGSGTDLDANHYYVIGIVTMNITHGSTNTRIWNNTSSGTTLRVYSGGSLTFSVPAGYAVTKVTFDGSANFNELSNGVWIASEEPVSTITFTHKSSGNNSSIRTITVEYEENALVVDAPTLPASTNFYSEMTIEITNNTSGATVYYTTDGSDPKTSNTRIEYTQAFTLNATTTVKAVALKDSNYSQVVEATYALVDVLDTMQAVFNAAGDETTNVFINFNSYVVSGVSTNCKSVFVTDNSGNGFVIFNNNGGLDQTYSVGSILSGTAVPCNLVKYNGFAELLNVDASNLTITAGGTVSTSNIAMADLAGVNTGALVSYESLTCSVDNSGDTPKYYLTDGTTTLQVYNSLYAFNALENGKKYNITGIYQQYHDGKEILPRSAADIVPIFTKHITGYTNNGGYYLIASPIGTVDPEEVTNMITDNDVNNNRTYDLYRFQQDPSDGLEWRNYRQGVFDLEVGKGYLYAHRTDVDLVFTGSAISESTYEVPLTKVAAASGLDFPDWNLVGNPFADVAHFANNHPFYTLDVSGAYTLVSDGSQTIESMEGVFVVAGENETQITFVKGESSKKSPKVTLNVSKGTEPGVIDRAIVCFGETRQMPKFQLFKNSTKVYIPMEGKDYALVRGEEMGAMPVNFKAEENGTYSMNFTCENVGFAYLHLIDNKTGNDVDLLKTPSYSFEAKTTDYESRFKLVFATGDNSNDDNFAFFSNGSFVINNEGEAELQVIDMMGRILSSETINGCTNVNVNAAPGVYMLRLVNGDNVKVQKVIVK